MILQVVPVMNLPSLPLILRMKTLLIWSTSITVEGLHRKIKSLWSTGRQEHRRYVPKILDYTSTQPRDNEWNAHT